MSEGWGKFEMQWGQWKGRTMKQIHEIDPTYIDWIIETVDEDSMAHKAAKDFRLSLNKKIIGNKKIGKIFG